MEKVFDQHRLADSVRTDEDDVGGVVDEGEGEQLLDEGAVDALGPGPVEVGDRFEGADARWFLSALDKCGFWCATFSPVPKDNRPRISEWRHARIRSCPSGAFHRIPPPRRCLAEEIGTNPHHPETPLVALSSAPTLARKTNTSLGSGQRCCHTLTVERMLYCVRGMKLARAFILAPALAVAPPILAASPLDRMLNGSGLDALNLETCTPQVDSELHQALSTITGCVANGAASSLLDEFFTNLDVRGKNLFGNNFHIDNDAHLPMSGGGLIGDLDAVVPVHSYFSNSGVGPDPSRSYFLQSGLSRWTDAHGHDRNDMRLGLVHRFTLTGGLDRDVVGVSAFLQESLEVGHQRFVAGVDYAGLWGRGSLTYFMPTTSWRRGRSGYEERALEGLDLGLRLEPTTTIALNGRLGRWEAKDGSSTWAMRGRIGVTWRPHSWIRLATELTSIGTSQEGVEIQAAIAIPIGGGPENRARWQGLGKRQGLGLNGQADSDIASLWRSVDAVGPIEFAERRSTYITGQVVSDATVRFLQDSAGSGSEIRMVVTLANPVSDDTLFVVRLIPGTGENAAVPGEDFVDAPIDVVIGAGETAGSASIELLHNPDLDDDRSLSALVTVG